MGDTHCRHHATTIHIKIDTHHNTNTHTYTPQYIERERVSIRITVIQLEQSLRR